jgi:hypothetical protein
MTAPADREPYGVESATVIPTLDRQELAAVFAGGAIGALCRGLLEEA